MSDKTTNPESQEATEAAPNQQQSQETTQTPQRQTPESVQAFKALMDRERTLREREQKLQREAQEISRYRDLPKRAQENPLEALKELGISYEELVKRAAKGERPDPTEPIRSEMEELKRQLQSLTEREREQERLSASEQAKQGIRKYLDESAEDYPLTSTIEGADAMTFDYMAQHYQTTGEWLSEDDAAREVEAYLSTVVEQALKNEAVRAKYLQGSSTTRPETPHITNGDASQVSSRQDKPLSMEEKLRMAAEVMERGAKNAT